MHGELIDKIIKLLKSANSLLFITGAGISADSGLPTYRGIGGLYNTETEDNIPIEVALSGQMFAQKPELTWKYLHQIADASKGATFNRAHEIIALMEKQFKRVWVLTQNVDGFHRSAGSQNVIDIHGDFNKLVCHRCQYNILITDYCSVDAVPNCPRCSQILRPNVILFGELLPPAKVALMQRELAKPFDVVFSVGTSSVFPYISGPVLEARYNNIPTVEINPGESEISQIVDIKLPLGAADAFEKIWQRYNE